MICSGDIAMWLPATYAYVVIARNLRVRICAQRGASLQLLTSVAEQWGTTTHTHNWNVLKYANKA